MRAAAVLIVLVLRCAAPALKLVVAFERAQARYGVLGVRPVKAGLSCQPVVGAVLVVVFVLRAYSTVWLPGLLPVMLSVFSVMPVDVGVPLDVGAPLTAAPSPIPTLLALTVPETATAAVAPVTLAAATVPGIVRVRLLALYALGAPVIGTVTTVLLVRVAVPALSPPGRFDTAKFAGVMELAYCPLESV